jgi:glycosyltransferase involved in cell wall biosynthesis
MKKICFICPSLTQGGLENAVMVIANEMADLGYEVSIICVYNNPVFYTLRKSIEIVLPAYNRKKYSTITYYYKSAIYIRKHLKSIKPDVIISYGDYINFISILAIRFLNIPTFISDRSSPNKHFPFLINLLRKVTYGKSDGIIAQTDRARDQKKKMLPGYKNIKVIPNPLRPIIKHPDIIKENIILGVGRHYHVKGLDRLIKAIAEVELNDWKLVIAGSLGPETEELKLLVKNLNLGEKVEFLGAIKEIDKVFSKSKIFVLPSRSEGFPNALIEAMAHGLPSVAFDIVSGPAEIIKDKVNGILIDDNDIDSMSQAINEFISNEKLRDSISKEALKINEELSVSIVTKKYLDFINLTIKL